MNEDDMGCVHGEAFRVTCGTCQRNWCDVCKPTPSARCPYEYEHDEVFDEDESKPTFEDLVNDFWLLVEPVYQRFDELTKARIDVALEVFKGHLNG